MKPFNEKIIKLEYSYYLNIWQSNYVDNKKKKVITDIFLLMYPKPKNNIRNISLTRVNHLI